jgi:uncharacterized protein YeaO (DUF488 family)
MLVRTDCYLAVSKKFKKMYPNAHFEYVSRSRFNSVLSPSVDLLTDAGIYKKPDGSRNPRMSWQDYKKAFKKEIQNNTKSLKRLKKLKEIAKEKTVFLVCFEKDASKCHRSILKEMMMENNEHITKEKERKNDIRSFFDIP